MSWKEWFPTRHPENARLPILPPRRLTTIRLETQEVALVVPKKVVQERLDYLARKINPSSYEIIFYNRNGGVFLRRELESRWSRRVIKSNTPIVPIEYRSYVGPNSQDEIQVTTPLCFYRKSGVRALILEDLDDTGKTLGAINDDAQELNLQLEIAILINKKSHKEVINHNIAYVGMELPDLWIGGGGANLSIPALDAEFDRHSPQIVMPLPSARKYYGLAGSAGD